MFCVLVFLFWNMFSNFKPFITEALIKYAQLLFMTYEEFFIDSFLVDLFYY